MWVWTLNWDQVRDDLVIGSCPMSADDVERIGAETEATALLSLQTDECRGAFDIDYAAHRRHGRRRGLTLVNAPMRDFDPPDQRKRLPAAVGALLALLAGGHRVYVHCTAGINRAPLTVLGYLTFVETMTPDAALTLIHAARPGAEPYWEAYDGCRDDLVARHRDAIEVRAVDLSRGTTASSPDEHWYRAEREVLRDVFLADTKAPSARLDPHRS